MEVIAFVGSAGTGKSYRAQKVARDENADAIIDDGLFIQGGKVWAGNSAKSEENRIQAVKRAIFNDPKQVKKVKAAIESAKPKRLLILGTSNAMVKRIAAKLEIPEPTKYIKIEDVATPREIAKAKESRTKEGKHIVPVPTVALKPHYSGYFIDPFKGFFSKSKQEQHEYGSKSIVRPSFSMYGKMLIADSAIEDIVKLVLQEIKEIKSIVSINVRTVGENAKKVIIDVEIILIYGSIIKEVVNLAQHLIKHQVETMTAMNVNAVNMSIRRLALR